MDFCGSINFYLVEYFKCGAERTHKKKQQTCTTHLAQQNPKEMSDLYVKAVVGRGSFGLVKLVYHKRDKQLGLMSRFPVTWVYQGQGPPLCFSIAKAEVLCPEVHWKEAGGTTKTRKIHVVGTWDQLSMLSPVHHALHYDLSGAGRVDVGTWMWCHVRYMSDIEWYIWYVMHHDAVDSVSIFPGHQECLLLDRVSGWWWLVHSHPRHWKSQ